MGLKSKFKVEDYGFLAASIFHVIVGVLCLIILFLESLELIHIWLICIFNMATAYGLFKRRFWALWTIFVSASMATVFVLSMFYHTLGSDIYLNVTLSIYVILTWIFTVYVASKRGKLRP
jgi:uncharacterized membrane protein HdeD (DUF308 family)